MNNNLNLSNLNIASNCTISNLNVTISSTIPNLNVTNSTVNNLNVTSNLIVPNLKITNNSIVPNLNITSGCTVPILNITSGCTVQNLNVTSNGTVPNLNVYNTLYTNILTRSGINTVNVLINTATTIYQIVSPDQGLLFIYWGNGYALLSYCWISGVCNSFMNILANNPVVNSISFSLNGVSIQATSTVTINLIISQIKVT